MLNIGRLLPHPCLQVRNQALRLAGIAVIALSLLADVLWLRGWLTRYQPVVSIIAVLTPIELGFAMVLLPALGFGQKSGKGTGGLWFWLSFVPAVVLALGRGMITPLMKPLLIYVLGFLYVRRQMRLWPLLAALFAVILLQPVKAEFRARMWDRQVDSGLLERGALYVELIGRHWFGGDMDREVDKAQSVHIAAARTAGALALANAIELTPAAIPHQWGKTYQYFRHALIPRIFDPDKPVAQYADIWAAVMYGYTNQRGTEHVMIGLSQIAEAYINFGFPLCFLMLMLIGVLLRIMDEVFAHPHAQNGALAIYLYFLQSIMFTQEGSLAQFWGGVAQQFLAYTLAMALLAGLFRKSKALS